MGLKGQNKIDVIRDILRAYKAMQTVPRFEQTKKVRSGVLPLMVFLLIELVGPQIVKEIIIKFLSKELDNAQKSMKDSLKSSLISDTSSKSSGIPDNLKSTGQGVNIPLNKVDKESVIKQDPSTEEGKDMLPDGSFERFLQNLVNGPPGSKTFKDTIVAEYDDTNQSVNIKAHNSQDNKPWSSFVGFLIDGMVIINSRMFVKIIIDYIFGTLSPKRFSKSELVEKLKTDEIINKIKDEDENPFDLSKTELNTIEDQSSQLSKGVNEIDLGCGSLPISFDITTLNGITDSLNLVEPQSIQQIDNMLTDLGDEVVKTVNSNEDKETIRQGFLRKFLDILEFALIRSVIIGVQPQLLYILVDVFKGNITLDVNGTIEDTSNTTTQDINNRKTLVKNLVRQIKGILVKSVFSTFKKECDDLKSNIVPIYIKDVFTLYRKQLLSLFGIRDNGIIS